MTAHLGAEEAQQGARKLENHIEVHLGAREDFLEPWQLTLEQRRLIVEPGRSQAMEANPAAFESFLRLWEEAAVSNLCVTDIFKKKGVTDQHYI
jgi:hypothetical protein